MTHFYRKLMGAFRDSSTNFSMITLSIVPMVQLGFLIKSLCSFGHSTYDYAPGKI